MAIAEFPAQVSVIDVARDAVGAVYGQSLWQCTDDVLVEEITSALALRAQADAVLLARLAVGLAGVGEQLFAVLDPIGYQRAQEDKLERAERGAYAERGFTLSPDTIGSGSLIRGSGWAGGDAIISAALDALAAPRPADEGGPDLRSAAARRYDALHDLCRRSLHAEATGSGDGGKVQSEVHHLKHWADGGPTAVDNGALACGEHHPLFETGDWQPELINGRIWVRPPPTIDPDRKPRINHLHRPLPLRR